MPNAWGSSWGGDTGAWGLSWGAGEAPPPPAVGVPPPLSGGHPWLGPYARRRHIWMDRVPGPVAETIQELAKQQIEHLDLPKHIQAIQLKRELRLKDIQYKARYFEALALERELLIELEIAERLHAKLVNDEELAMLIILASI